jgi:hypothetical protein
LISDGVARRIGHVRRWQVAVVSIGCIAAMMLLWLSFDVDPTWQWWVRAVTIAVIPVCFFGALAVGLALDAARAEKGLSPEERQRRRQEAWQHVSHDVAPLLSRPDLFVRPVAPAWELWRSHPPEESPDPTSGPAQGRRGRSPSTEDASGL